MTDPTSWLAALEASSPGCSEYATVLDSILEATPDHLERALLAALAEAAALTFDSDDPKRPLAQRFMAIGRSPETFDDDALDAMKAVAPSLPADLRARVRDVLWIARRGREIDGARLMVDDYSEAAAALGRSGANGFDHPAQRLRRALHVASSMKWSEGVERTRDRIREIMRDETTRADVRVNAADLALVWGEADAREASAVAERFAEEVLSTVGTAPLAWDWPRYALGLAAKAAERSADGERALRLRVRRAETYLLHERWLAERPDVAAGVRVMVLQKGLVAYRESGAGRELIDVAHARLLAAQLELTKEMKRHAGPTIDLTEVANRAIERVRGRTFAEALEELITLAPPPTVTDLRERAIAGRRQFPLQHILQAVQLDREGRTVATRPGATQDAEGVALEHMMFEHARLQQQVMARAAINAAREQIVSEHPGSRRDWLLFLRDRALVQPARIFTLAAGLAAGLAGDRVSSACILAPQLEHIIRMLVRSQGGLTSVFDRGDLTQREAALGVMLGRPELAKILGEDLVFDLRGLLDDDAGANLRNRIAHGLCEDDELMSVDALYLWFSTLRLVVAVSRPTERPDDGPSLEPEHSER